MSDVVNIIKLHASIIKRALLLFPQKEKDIELINFTYKPDFDTNDTVIIRYAFKNVLWYRFDGKKTLESRQVVVRHSNTSKDITLTVQGFLRKNLYTIKLQPDAVFIVEDQRKTGTSLNIDTIL